MHHTAEKKNALLHILEQDCLSKRPVVDIRLLKALVKHVGWKGDGLPEENHLRDVLLRSLERVLDPVTEQ